MKKNIQKLVLFSALFVFSATLAFAGDDQCTIVPTPTPPGMVEYIETTPQMVSGSALETASDSDKANQLPIFIQQAIDVLSTLF